MGGFFVEAGAYNGEELSNTLYFEKERGWTGLLIEPDPWNYYALQKRKRNVFSVQCCLSRADVLGQTVSPYCVLFTIFLFYNSNYIPYWT